MVEISAEVFRVFNTPMLVGLAVLMVGFTVGAMMAFLDVRGGLAVLLLTTLPGLLCVIISSSVLSQQREAAADQAAADFFDAYGVILEDKVGRDTREILMISDLDDYEGLIVRANKGQGEREDAVLRIYQDDEVRTISLELDDDDASEN